MSYGNKYSNKPFESASKISHTNIINDNFETEEVDNEIFYQSVEFLHIIKK